MSFIAATFSEYGPPEVLELTEVSDETPGSEEVRVRVRAGGLQPLDYKLRNGSIQGFVPAHFPQRLGMEFAGVIDAVGDAVSDRAIGDEVIGWMSKAGAPAELLVAPAANTIIKPAELAWEPAGALSSGGQTADTILEMLSVGPSDTLLVHAAAGGVGTLAVQLARQRGAQVIGTGSPDSHDHIRSPGATPVTYGRGLADRLRAVDAPITAALDAAGTDEAITSSVEVVPDPTRVITIAGTPADELPDGVSWAGRTP